MLMKAATVVQQLCKSGRTCFKFYCMFYFTCDRCLNWPVRRSRWHCLRVHVKASTTTTTKMIPSTTPRAMNSACRLLANRLTPWPSVLISHVTSLVAGATSSAVSTSGNTDASDAATNDTETAHRSLLEFYTAGSSRCNHRQNTVIRR